MPRPSLRLLLCALAIAAAPGVGPRPAVAAIARADTTLMRLRLEARTLVGTARWAAADSVCAIGVTRAEVPPPDSSALAELLSYRGRLRLARGQIGDTLTTQFLGRSIQIQRRLARPDIPLFVAAIDALGRVLSEQDHADSALRVLAEGRTLCGPQVAEADTMRATLWIATGRVLRRVERFDQALAAFDSARVLRMRRSGPESPAVAEALADIGAIYGRTQRPDEALAALGEAIAILDRTVPPDSPLLIRPLSELAAAQSLAGDIAGSITTLERVVEITAHQSGPDSPRAIPTEFNIALRLFDFGDYAGARALLVPLVPRAETAFGAGTSRTEYIRMLAGASALMAGDTASAAPMLAKTRAAMAGKPLDANHVAIQTEFYRAMLFQKEGDLPGAQRALTDGLDRERAWRQPNPSVLLQLLGLQLEVQIARGDSAGVDRTLVEYADRFGAFPGTPEPLHATYLRGRAAGERWRGRRDAAWQYALQSEAMDRADLMRNARALPDQRALQLAGVRGEGLDLLVAMSGPGGDSTVATAWDRVVRWRGLVTSVLSERRAPRLAAADTALAAAHARWVRSERHTARLEVADAEGGAGAALAASRAEAETAERRYATLATARGIVRDTTTVSLVRVRAALAPDAALVSIVTIASRTDSARFVGFATLGPNGALRRTDLGSARDLRTALAAWRALLETPPARGHERDQERACRARGADVRARTWDRLSPLFAGARTVVLVADGDWADLPWQALPVEHDRYLVEQEIEIQTPGAERELLTAPAPGAHGLLALGDPDFNHADSGARPAASDAAPTAPPSASPALELLRGLRDDCRAASALALPPLPGARAEVDDITATWNASGANPPASLLVGAAASERAFKSDAPGQQVLHLATHGVLWGEGCRPMVAGLRGVGGVAPVDAAASPPASAKPKSKGASTAASTAPSPTTSSASADGGALSVSPWSGRRVWLALAGANQARTGAADENEGLLTADEVVTLDLSNVQWVVLSACQSGVGQQWPLEGAAGMRRAFRLAGARTVIASQWPIADQSTREWMKALYTARTGAEVRASAAMRAASRSVLEARRHAHRDTHPFYWAAFTATGN